MKFIYFSILIVVALFPSTAEGMTFFFRLADTEYFTDDTFVVEARILIEQKEDLCINALEAYVSFSPKDLQMVDFSQGNSILSLWLDSPEEEGFEEINRRGNFAFAGGIPGGYCGIIPGDPQDSHLLAKIAFRAVGAAAEPRTTAINFLKDSFVFLADGFGTPIEAKLEEKLLFLLPEKRDTPQDEWQTLLGADTVPPEPFEIELHQDSEMFEGRYFIIFSTTDKQSGIAFYEVKQGKKDWKKGESPYLLENQGLKSIIKVRAVDKAGNERIVEYSPPEKPFPYWIIILVIIGLIIIGWLVTKYAKNIESRKHAKNRREK